MVVVPPIRIQDGKQTFKHHGHQYRDFTRARKVRLTCIKGTSLNQATQKNPEGSHDHVSGSDEQLWRESNPHHKQPRFYDLNLVDFNVPRVIIPTSEATAR